ncbi:unnamed protein product [Trichogramma brassicae]|uniref:Peptidase M13 N-terminal domain-containing protein n=1 Tax=Trichogramma brassicae TaxID=86971 RepID=A0A6H5IML3_9HYME|nr:unnamed protein product [Trichogramma brassicae]
MSSRLLLLLLLLLGCCSASYVLQPDVDHCERPQCAPIDEILVANVDPDVEPCGNFYGFACAKGLGELERDFLTRGARTSSSVTPADPHRAADRVIYDFTDLRSTYEKDEILDEPLTDDDPDDGDLNVDSLRVERQIYEICKRGVHTRQERLHYEQLLARNRANRLEANVQYDPLQAEQQHWSRTDLRYALGGFGFAFFEVDVIERRQPFVHVKRYLQLRPTVDNVLDLNDLLTAKYMKHELDRRPIYDHHPNNNDPNYIPPLKKYSDIKDFIREFNKINWLNIFKELLGKISVNVYDHDLIIIKHENYFFRLAELLKLTRDVNTIGRGDVRLDQESHRQAAERGVQSAGRIGIDEELSEAAGPGRGRDRLSRLVGQSNNRVQVLRQTLPDQSALLRQSIKVRRDSAEEQAASSVRVRRADFRNEEFVQRFTAYLLGLQTAYRAWPTKDSYPIQFRNFGTLTDFRLFFLSFAEVIFVFLFISNKKKIKKKSYKVVFRIASRCAEPSFRATRYRRSTSSITRSTT